MSLPVRNAMVIRVGWSDKVGVEELKGSITQAVKNKQINE